MLLTSKRHRFGGYKNTSTPHSPSKPKVKKLLSLNAPRHPHQLPSTVSPAITRHPRPLHGMPAYSAALAQPSSLPSFLPSHCKNPPTAKPPPPSVVKAPSLENSTMCAFRLGPVVAVDVFKFIFYVLYLIILMFFYYDIMFNIQFV